MLNFSLPKNFYIILRLWKLVKPFHRDFYFQLVLTIVVQSIQIVTVYLSARIINNLLIKDFTSSIYFAFGVFFLNLISYTLQYFTDRNTIKFLENEMEQYLQKFSFEKIFQLNPSQYTEDHSSVKYHVIKRGEDALKNIISTLVLTLIPTITQVLFSILAIAYFSPLIALVSAITFLTASLWSNYFAKYHRKFIKQNTDNWDKTDKVRSETFQHLNLIKVSGVEESYLKKYLKNRSKNINFDNFTWNKNNINNKLRFSFFNLSRTITTIIIIYEAILGRLLIGNIFAIWSWMSSAYGNISNITQATRQLPLRFVELEKYLDIVDKAPNFKEKGTEKFVVGDISFENLSFKYPRDENNIFKNLNFNIPVGKKIAFVGFSGSGKSTIVKLLLRMYDWDKGDIKLAGKSLRGIDAKTLRQKIGYVEQHVDLFDASIRENILFGIPENSKKINDNQLSEIIHKARIDQFFHRLGVTGLDTVIGERGVKLSGGERQRIGIARALAKDPEILIFDEATASLDTENEKYIQEAIDESSEGRTTIIIAHRLSTVQNADVIFVMDKGEIVGQGTNEFLKQNNPQYQRLIQAQENNHTI